jgi:hypothetical protein
MPAMFQFGTEAVNIIHKFQTTPPGIRQDIVFEWIFLPIFLQHV